MSILRQEWDHCSICTPRRFEAGIDDEVEKVGRPDPALFTLEYRLTQAFTVVDDAVAAEVAEGGLGVEHVF